MPHGSDASHERGVRGAALSFDHFLAALATIAHVKYGK